MDNGNLLSKGASSARQAVTVTGASGFLGTHVVQSLLEHGYSVIALVRNARGAAVTGALAELATQYPGRVEVRVADLVRQGVCDEAFAKSTHVIHCAAQVAIGTRKGSVEASHVFNVNRASTHSVLSSLARAPHLKAVVMTSSMATVLSFHKEPAHEYDEMDWSDARTRATDAYYATKFEAEKRFCDHFEAAKGIGTKLVRILPSMLIGPAHTAQHTRTSLRLLLDLYKGKMRACPDMHYHLVDVREVALLHVKALGDDIEAGRFIVPGQAASIATLAQMIKRAAPESRAPQRRIPNWMMYLSALFMPQLSFAYLRRSLGVNYRFNDDKVRDRFRLSYRSLESSIADSVHAFRSFG